MGSSAGPHLRAVTEIDCETDCGMRPWRYSLSVIKPQRYFGRYNNWYSVPTMLKHANRWCFVWTMLVDWLGCHARRSSSCLLGPRSPNISCKIYEKEWSVIKFMTIRGEGGSRGETSWPPVPGDYIVADVLRTEKPHFATFFSTLFMNRCVYILYLLITSWAL